MLDANRTEDQSTENLAAVLNIFQRIVNESVVLDNQVSSSPSVMIKKLSCWPGKVFVHNSITIVTVVILFLPQRLRQM